MKHFIVGPVETYKEVQNIYKQPYLYFRSNEFGEFVKETLNRLSSLIGNNDKNSLLYLTMSGTGAMEATIENCVTPKDKVLVINGGIFGQRFCELLKFHNIPFDSINLKWNESLTKEHLEYYENKGYTTLFVNLHETSTGQLYDVKLLSEFTKRNNMFFIVDAISTFLADTYDMSKYNIDVTIISSQKGLCLSPGLSFVSLSKRIIDKIYKTTPSSLYFDFKDYLKNIERGQTPYTPAVFIMYELKAILDLIDNSGGLEKWLSNIKEKCQYFREQICKIGLNIPTTYNLSNTMTPVICDTVNANELVKYLRDHYEICVNPCGGNRANYMFRVSHIGNTTKKDIDILIDKIQKTIEVLAKRN